MPKSSKAKRASAKREVVVVKSLPMIEAPAASVREVVAPPAVRIEEKVVSAPGQGKSRAARKRRLLKTGLISVSRSENLKKAVVGHATSSRNVSVSTADAEAYLLDIVAPGGQLSGGARYSTAYTGNPTAVGDVHVQADAVFAGGESSTLENQPPDGSTWRFVFHDAVRHSVQYKHVTATFSYMGFMTQALPDESAGPGPFGTVLLSEDPEWLPLRFLNANSTTNQPHGQYWPPGRDDTDSDAAFYWFNKPGEVDDFVMNLAVNTTTGHVISPSVVEVAYGYELYRWSGRKAVMIGEHTYAAIPIANTQAVSVMEDLEADDLTEELSPGYYAIKLYAIPYSGTDVQLPVSIPATVDLQYLFTVPVAIPANRIGCWAHEMMPGLADHLSTTKGIRVKGTAAMATCSAAMINAGGTLAIYQMPAVDPWFTVSDHSLSEFAASYPMLKQRTAVKGQYKFLRPDSPKFWDMDEQIEFFGVLRNLEYSLVPRSGVLAQLLTMPVPTGSNTVPAGSAYWTRFVSWEYETTDPWAEVKMPGAKASELEKYVEAVRDLDDDYENPTHILSMLGQLFSAGVKYLPKLATTANAVQGIWGSKRRK